MADLSQFLNSGGKILKTVDVNVINRAVGWVDIVEPNFIITPAADQYVSITGAVRLDGGETLVASLRFGGVSFFNGDVGALFETRPTAFSMIGGKGEEFTMIADRDGTSGSPTLELYYQLLEEV